PGHHLLDREALLRKPLEQAQPFRRVRRRGIVEAGRLEFCGGRAAGSPARRALGHHDAANTPPPSTPSPRATTSRMVSPPRLMSRIAPTPCPAGKHVTPGSASAA